MPLPRRLARFNRSATNRITRPFASRLGGFAVVHHRGRRSGTEYETPVNAWHHNGHIVVALTYGPDVDWLKNTMASDESVFVMGGVEVTVGKPVHLSPEAGASLMPAIVRQILKIINVDEFVDFPVFSQTS